MPNPQVRFHWRETEARIAALWHEHRLVLDRPRRSFIAADPDSGLRVTPPLVLPIAAGVDSVEDYLAGLPDAIGVQVVVLVQAGASALGVWQEDDNLAHRVIRKYVVRGNGRAQTTHLKTKGKSRYGSRLRLQGAKAQLVETNQTLIEWDEAHGGFDQVLVSCPVRTLADLHRTRPPPPFAAEVAVRIPFHVHPPRYEELLRIRARLAQGVIEFAAAGLPAVGDESEQADDELPPWPDDVPDDDVEWQ